MSDGLNQQRHTDVNHFISQMTDVKRKKDAYQLLKIFEQASGFEPRMWGPSMVGFGKYHYMIEEKFEGDAPLVAFALKKTKINLYLAAVNSKGGKQLKQLGKYRRGKSCLYIKEVNDIDEEVLHDLILASIQYLTTAYEPKK
ncbi:DUF1801 domain-containing protein [Macrococcus equipercicus]|uniref:DUF1801 domain-containing protein n=1 Tax=Macrococcus equipercicus TaxID=69967 RepID=A0A9Q9BP97_9STAP|nr:DUF1801 domain-containing protein [Macrococcus equipercicus]KAA1038427.1 DUF1801 domain-containing protein [Macrococcus equipercicus]UTH13186.1 DUF1801 domain-containing protein [Macrococcus equipercicus]